MALPESREARLGRLALLVSLACLLHLFWEIGLSPVLAADALVYHLALPAHWLQKGMLAPVDLPFHDGAAEHGPMLLQLLFHALMQLTGDDGLVGLVQPAAFLLLLALFHRSARLSGLGRGKAGLLTALLALFSPFQRNAQLAQNDLVHLLGAALLLHGMLLARRRPSHSLLFQAAGMGILLATKTVGILFSAAALPFLLAAAWRVRRRPGILALAALLPLLGSSFLLRNWILHANPLFPAEIRLGGLTLFKGLYDPSPFLESHLSLAGLVRLFVEDSQIFAPRHPFGLLLVLGALACLWLRQRLPWLLFAAAATGLLLALKPFRMEHRYFFPIYYALWLCAAAALARARGAWVPWLLGALLAWRHREMLWASEGWFYLLAALGSLLLLLPRWPSRFVLRTALAGVLLATCLSPLWYPGYRAGREAARAEAYARWYGPKGEVWGRVDALGRSGPLTVAYAGTPFSYPLFGPRLRNRVLYVPLSSGDGPGPVALDARSPFGFECQLARARRGKVDEDFWLEGLRRQKVDLLYLSHNPALGGVEAELGMVERHPEAFELITRKGPVSLYRVLR